MPLVLSLYNYFLWSIFLFPVSYFCCYDVSGHKEYDKCILKAKWDLIKMGKVIMSWNSNFKLIRIPELIFSLVNKEHRFVSGEIVYQMWSTFRLFCFFLFFNVILLQELEKHISPHILFFVIFELLWLFKTVEWFPVLFSTVWNSELLF